MLLEVRHEALELLFFHSVSAGGGGCSGGDGDVAPPNTVEFFALSNAPLAYPVLTASAFGGALVVTFPIPPAPAPQLPSLQGTYDSATDAYTLAISTGPVAWVDVASPVSPYDSIGNLEVGVTRTFKWTDELDPTEGEFTITSRNGSFPGKITATVVASPAPGVNVNYDSDGNGTPDLTQFYDWAAFDDLLETPGVLQYQAVAAFTYAMRDFLYEHATIAQEAFTMIEDGFAGFEAGGNGTTLESDCSPGSPAGGANKVRVTWHDNDGDGTISSTAGNEDSFSFVMDNCWFDDPTDDIDTLLNGQMELMRYTRALQGCPVYANFKVEETNDLGVIADSAVTSNGSFCIFLPGIGD
jgi:hypothetical protein